MKITESKPNSVTKQNSEESALKTRGLIAAKAMSKALREEHRRWNMPLLSWKDGKVVKVKP